MIRRLTPAALGFVVALGGAAQAQRATEVPPVAERGLRQPGRGTREQALAGQVRKAFSGVVRRELSLNDDQAKRLEQVDQRYQKQRNELNRDEREARLALKAALEDSTVTPDQAKVDDYLSRLVKAQRRRADLLESEQKDLSAFLTPVQRAKYFALRDQLSRRIAALRQDTAPGLGRRGATPPR